MTSNSNASVVNKNVTVLLMEKVVPNVKIEFNKPFEFPDPDFHNKDFIDAFCKIISQKIQRT